MKRNRTLWLLLAAALLLSCLTGCGQKPPLPPEESAAPAEPTPEPTPEPAAVDDGRSRPSNSGKLRVVDGKLCSESGERVMLRGVSSHSLMTAEDFLNAPLFRELSQELGVNVFRLAMYTYGVGIIGYCTNGDKERHKQDVDKGVELARSEDMYAIIDWHILSDGDPNRYLDEAKLFFAEMAEKYRDHNNVLYEICNEPNGVDWPTVKRYAEQVIGVIREKDPDAVVIVGSPDWSKALRDVAADPLPFGNVLYTFHFYAASHGEEYRSMLEELSEQGLPVFVTEYGVTAASGGHPRDLESADAWIELLEKENISYCMWSYSAAPEPCSALRSGVLKYSGFTRDDYNATGQWLLDTLARYDTR